MRASCLLMAARITGHIDCVVPLLDVLARLPGAVHPTLLAPAVRALAARNVAAADVICLPEDAHVRQSRIRNWLVLLMDFGFNE